MTCAPCVECALIGRRRTLAKLVELQLVIESVFVDKTSNFRIGERSVDLRPGNLATVGKPALPSVIDVVLHPDRLHTRRAVDGAEPLMAERQAVVDDANHDRSRTDRS